MAYNLRSTYIQKFDKISLFNSVLAALVGRAILWPTPLALINEAESHLVYLTHKVISQAPFLLTKPKP